MPWSDMGAGLLGQEKFDEMHRTGPAKIGGASDLGAAFAGRPLSEKQMADERAGITAQIETSDKPSDAELEAVRQAAREAPDEDDLAARIASEEAMAAADEALDSAPKKKKK